MMSFGKLGITNTCYLTGAAKLYRPTNSRLYSLRRLFGRWPIKELS